MPFVTTRDDVRLSFSTEGQGQVVVLVAGFTGRASSWQLQVDALVRAGFRVVAVDRRQHGLSDFPEHGQRMARHGADLHELKQVLDLPGAFWVGSSMGASALLSMCDLFGATDVAGLCLVDQTPKIVNDETWNLGLHGLTWDGVHEFVRTFPGGLSAFHVPPPPQVVAMLGSEAQAPPYPLDEARRLLRDHVVQDWRDVVQRLQVPVLAVAGRHSPMWPAASSEWLGEHAPHGAAVILEESGHAPHLSEPELFNEVLIDWLRSAA